MHARPELRRSGFEGAERAVQQAAWAGIAAEQPVTLTFSPTATACATLAPGSGSAVCVWVALLGLRALHHVLVSVRLTLLHGGCAWRSPLSLGRSC